MGFSLSVHLPGLCVALDSLSWEGLCSENPAGPGCQCPL